MSGFNFMSHGSQDLYPTMLTNQYNKTANEVTIIQVVANLGAIIGGIIVGSYSQVFGRRFSIIVISIIGGALLYPYSFTANNGVAGAAFFEQFCVQGAWGYVSSFPDPILSLGSLALFFLLGFTNNLPKRDTHSLDGTLPRLLPHLRSWCILPTR